ncbi:MAG: hypothetical protein JOZ39_06045, partial [Chloroflexi bacterium]|nr:hypothetical protein [Chloroflexota bacterium]
KEYEIRLKAAIDEAALARIRRGVQSGGDLLRPLRLQAVAGSNGTELLAVLGEGKKREIRRMFEACGREVIRLRRVRLGPLWLGSLPSGEFRELTKAEIDQLRAAISA